MGRAKRPTKKRRRRPVEQGPLRCRTSYFVVSAMSLRSSGMTMPFYSASPERKEGHSIVAVGDGPFLSIAGRGYFIGFGAPSTSRPAPRQGSHSLNQPTVIAPHNTKQQDQGEIISALIKGLIVPYRYAVMSLYIPHKVQKCRTIRIVVT
jgi:hypothetical protein